MISGEEWKDIRSTFTPIFTSGKIKGMARLINDISVKLVDSLDADAMSGGEFDARVKFGKFRDPIQKETKWPALSNKKTVQQVL